jgi:hypothetical protein
VDDDAGKRTSERTHPSSYSSTALSPRSATNSASCCGCTFSADAGGAAPAAARVAVAVEDAAATVADAVAVANDPVPPPPAATIFFADASLCKLNFTGTPSLPIFNRPPGAIQALIFSSCGERVAGGNPSESAASSRSAANRPSGFVFDGVREGDAMIVARAVETIVGQRRIRFSQMAQLQAHVVLEQASSNPTRT